MTDSTSNGRDTILCFAYGSNLCPARFARRVTIISVLGVAELPKHDLRWHKRSNDKSGKCDAYYTGVDSDIVLGAVYEIPASDKEKLDKLEGLGHGYAEKMARLKTPSGEVNAVFYVAERHAIDAGLLPYDWYKEHVACGARDHQLPPPYQARIAMVAAIPDSDARRSAKENESRRPDWHPDLTVLRRYGSGHVGQTKSMA